MNYLPLLFCLFAPSCMAADGTPTIKVHSVTFNYMDLGNGAYDDKIVKGTTLVYRIEATEGNALEASALIWNKEDINLWPKDLAGNDLGKLLNAYDSFQYADYFKGNLFYYFIFPRLPSHGSERLDVSGKVPVTVFSDETLTQQLSVQNGAQLFLGNSTLEVKVPAGKMEDGQTKASFRVSSYGKEMKVIGMLFFDEEGKPLVEKTDYSLTGWGGGGSGGGGESSFYFEETTYSFKKDPGSSKLVLKYWAKQEEMDLPVPAEIPFHDPAEKE